MDGHLTLDEARQNLERRYRQEGRNVVVVDKAAYDMTTFLLLQVRARLAAGLVWFIVRGQRSIGWRVQLEQAEARLLAVDAVLERLGVDIPEYSKTTPTETLRVVRTRTGHEIVRTPVDIPTRPLRRRKS